MCGLVPKILILTDHRENWQRSQIGSVHYNSLVITQRGYSNSKIPPSFKIDAPIMCLDCNPYQKAADHPRATPKPQHPVTFEG